MIGMINWYSQLFAERRYLLMKIYAERIVETMVDKICDVCDESVVIEEECEESGTLSASFRYGSKEDGNVYNLDLCEACFKTALFALKDQRRAIFMFDDEKNNRTKCSG
jgi:hypothetical protein